jgi:hypothetical protein
MPNLHEIKLKAAVRKRQEEGHVMGTAKVGIVGDSNDASSQIARHHLAKKTSIYLFK